MTKREITMDEIVEGMARASYDCAWAPGSYEADYTSEVEREAEQTVIASALSHLLTTANITPDQLIALVNKKAVVVSVEPSGMDRILEDQRRVRVLKPAALKARPQ